jgi:hypothetical protein
MVDCVSVCLGGEIKIWSSTVKNSLSRNSMSVFILSNEKSNHIKGKILVRISYYVNAVLCYLGRQRVEVQHRRFVRVLI